MVKKIPIHPKDKTFIRLMKDAAKALRANNGKLLDKVKKEFAEDYISLFYNKETDMIRVLRKDCPPIDFRVDEWTSMPKK